MVDVGIGSNYEVWIINEFGCVKMFFIVVFVVFIVFLLDVLVVFDIIFEF